MCEAASLTTWKVVHQFHSLSDRLEGLPLMPKDTPKVTMTGALGSEVRALTLAMAR